MEILAFIAEHWQSIAIILTSGGLLVELLKKRAWSAFFVLCLDLVRKVAVEELSGKEKREAVVEAAYTKAPLWVKKLITEEQAETIAEQAYVLLRGELKLVPAPIPAPEVEAEKK